MTSNDEIKMTNDEIKKALEICVKEEYIGAVPDAVRNVIKDTLDLINQYEEKVKKCEKVEHFADKTIATLQEENKRLKDDNKFLQDRRFKELSEVKAEAYKEFVERLKEKFSQADILCPRRIISLTENELNNLLKEMGVE